MRAAVVGHSAPLDLAFDPKKNSLGFLRIVFAALVLLDHAFPLGGFNRGSDPMWGWTKGQESFGGLAVVCFFVVSGFLVTRSFVEARSALGYAWKRFLRIMPGFWVCLIVTVALFAPIAYLYQHGTVHGYVRGHTDSPLGYLTHNALLSMNQYNVDGLLGSTPYAHSGYPQAFDGSLWTLIFEAKCYIGVAALGLLGLYRRSRFSVVALSLALWAIQLKQQLHPGFLKGWPVIGDVQMVRLAFVFSLGVLLYLYRDKVVISNSLAAVAFAVLVIGMRTGLYNAIGEVALAYLCFWLAVRLPMSGFDRYGDFSYGLYIYAFPVEQLMALFGVHRLGLVPYVTFSLVVALALAVASWFVVEKPALSLKRLRLQNLSLGVALSRRWARHRRRGAPVALAEMRAAALSSAAPDGDGSPAF